MLDCGFSLRELQRRLNRVDLNVADLSAVFVTHEHQDHCKGVFQLFKQYQLPVFMTAGTAAGLRSPLPRPQIIRSGDAIEIGELVIKPVEVSHDANEPVQFRFDYGGLQLGILTDLGSFDAQVIAHYTGCHGLFLEFNYDPDLLESGPYPWFLKRRIAGDLGHLANRQAIELLEELDVSSLQHLIICHISQTNNCPQLLRQLLEDARAFRHADRLRGRIELACQREGCSWVELRHPVLAAANK